MAFASSETIRDRFKDCIKPYRKTRVQHAAYELSLGAEAVTTSDGALRTLDPATEGEDLGGHISIEPGQLAMLITEEVVAIPTGYLGFISIKAGIKLSGLVNISGFHVDPGFVGRLKFSVYNAGSDPVPLRRGQPTFLLWFAELDEPTEDVYDGKHKRQRHISSGDIANIQGELASPADLNRRLAELDAKIDSEISKLRADVRPYKDIAVRVGVGVVLILLGLAAGYFLDRPNEGGGTAEQVQETETRAPADDPSGVSPTDANPPTGAPSE